MRLAAHQPHYLPWLGYFDKMDQVDCFVILDDVQFEKSGWQNRSRIKTASGWQWVSVPILHRFPQTIAEVRISNATCWARKHLQGLVVNYAGAPAFAAHRPFLAEIYGRRWNRLVDLCLETLAYLADVLQIRTKVVLASSLNVPERESATDRLLAICRTLGAETYLSGAGARGYLDVRRFEAAGIGVCFQTFQCQPYPQRFGPFVPDLSVVDLLFNCGELSLEILRRGRLAS